MTNETLATYRAAAKEAKSRADKATPGPWKDRPSPVERKPYRCLYLGPSRDEPYSTSALEPQDAKFASNARTDIPALADAVVELVAEVERLQAWKREFILSLVPQLDYLAGAKSCPCGAREESLGTHSHVAGCAIGEARQIMTDMLKGKCDA